jgi:hypothetical protein
MLNVIYNANMPAVRKKVVQTELEPAEYETLLNLAKRKNMTIKEAAREALRYWNASNTDLSEDSLFRLKPVKFKIKVASNDIEHFLYGTGSSKKKN